MKTLNPSHYLTYLLLRAVIYPFSFFSYKTLHRIGNVLGVFAFYLLTTYRKRTLSNLSLAKDLVLSEKELHKLAKKSLGSLFTTCLEYGKLFKEKKIGSLVSCVNPSIADEIMKKGKGLIFLCGHQANWELFFLEGTSRMPGVAIGQPIKNTFLYRWVLSIRQKFGGKIVLPKEAVKEGLRALKQGKFLGVVGDQGMPDSGFCSPFLGTMAWTSPLPALLSYRNNTPIITATMERKDGKYLIHYCDPIFPNLEEPMEEEIPRLMKKALSFLEKSIIQNPSQWLWQHNRWKQQILGRVKKPYRQDAIAILLPKKPEDLFSSLASFREVYPREPLCFFTPIPLPMDLQAEEFLYQNYEEIKVKDYRFKLVFNFTGDKTLTSHFLNLAALRVLDLEDLRKEANLDLAPLSKLLTGALLHAH